MKLELYTKPEKPLLIEAFPGFGLIGSIVAEYLLEHLEFELIGRVTTDELPPVLAIHNEKIIEPFGLYHNKKFNILILHSINKVKGIEWQTARMIADIGKELGAKEILCVEGVMADNEKVYFHTNDEKKHKIFAELKVEPLKEGIIVGVTGALLISKDIEVTCLFAGAKAAIPDSMAASKILQVLNDYLKLELDLKPLIQKAEEFEKKIVDILNKGQEVEKEEEDKRQSYFG